MRAFRLLHKNESKIRTIRSPASLKLAHIYPSERLRVPYSRAYSSSPTAYSPLDSVTDIPIEQLPELGYSAGHMVMRIIENVHVFGGLPYWEAIVACTIGLRICLIPLTIKTAQNAARMAVMRPEMQKMQDAMKADTNFHDVRVKHKYQEEMKAMFVRYKVNPFQSMLIPFFQIPIFLSCFFGLRDMGNFFPGFTTGGDFWFTNLSVPDPYFILPIANALSFLVMIELGMEGLETNQKTQFVWAMRGLGVLMVPLTYTMPQGLFVYWSANNFLSITQAIVMKQEAVRTFLDIPKPPSTGDAPALKMKNPIKTIYEAAMKNREDAKRAEAEIIDGVVPPPPPPSGPPPTTFSQPPKLRKGSPDNGIA